ncbi:Trichodiene oxygenase [Penicillium rolfsii]|nr:Trichodiene oxygenase [Penicillium rolfsii]
MALEDFLALSTVIRLIGVYIAYHIIRALYNISPFHPLSHIPGPKLAAATWFYEGWYDLILGGMYTNEIRRMHEVYGPVVRVNPEELHFNDIAFVDEIYAGKGRKRDKQAHFLESFAGPIHLSAFGTAGHDHHRIRRNAVNKFFSRAQIARLETMIKELANKLCDKILRLETNTGKPFDITEAYSCFTSDVISRYCFGESFGFLEQENWQPNFREPMYGALKSSYIFRFLPFVKIFLDIAPLFANWFKEDFIAMLKEMNETMPARVRNAKKEHAAGVKHDHPSIFTALLDSSLSEQEKTDLRLGGEGFTMIGAGTETTAWTLSVVTVYLLTQPETLARLTKELQDADALNLPWFALEKLPYLNAVVTEALRLSYGVSTRLPRIAPNENLFYHGEFQGRKVEYAIPPGTPMGMSTVINHHNEDVFPDSHKFKPERWLDIEEHERRRMENSLTSFSRGSRQCLGMNLAYCNIYVGLATMTLRLFPRMKLYETDVDDVKYDHDLMAPAPKSDSKGVRAIIV